jgi:radical SAM superfamily enzyme YgiQ (UPF0313 family)
MRQSAIALARRDRPLGTGYYQTLSSRGCPLHCTYCYNSAFSRTLGPRVFFRRRSVAHLIGELGEARDQYPFIASISLADDSFFSAGMPYIREFAQSYAEHISLPFRGLGIPNAVTREKLAVLTKAGLYHLSLGVESVSRKAAEIYRRPVSKDDILAAARAMAHFKGSLLPPAYGLIVDNPYETRQDYLETLDFLDRIPGPRDIRLGSLVFYPGTLLYARARADGLIGDEKKEIYRKPYHAKKGTYINFLFYLYAVRAPAGLIRILKKPFAFFLLDRKILTPLFTFIIRGSRIASLLARSLFKGIGLR